MLSCWILVSFLIIANLAGFWLARRDKKEAARRRGGDRVPERAFLMLALLGAGLGIFLAFMLHRHKTRKWRFLAPFILATLVGAVLAGAWLALLC